MLSPSQESSLTSFGDCFEHWHSSDRILDHKSVLALQGASPTFPISDNFTINDNQDFLTVDTSLKNITITLPLANSGREIEIIKIASPNYISILMAGADKVFGESEIRIYNRGTALRFKAISGGWVFI